MRALPLPRAVPSLPRAVPAPSPATPVPPQAAPGLPRAAPAPPRWELREVVGRLTEISGLGGSACLTLAFTLVLEAQRQDEPVAWIAGGEGVFYPPDAAASGVDLEALAVVRVPDAPAAARAAARLARSGAFGLLVLDLGKDHRVPAALQARLRALAQEHDAAIVCLTEKAPRAPSLGSMVSLRGEARRRRLAEGRFLCELRVVKDKRRGPGWEHRELRRGPDGLV